MATDDVAPVAGTIANGATTNDNLPVLSGAAEPGATVKLSIDGGAPVTVVADGAGNWSYTPPTALADGRHTVSITAGTTGTECGSPRQGNRHIVARRRGGDEIAPARDVPDLVRNCRRKGW